MYVPKVSKSGVERAVSASFACRLEFYFGRAFSTNNGLTRAGVSCDVSFRRARRKSRGDAGPGIETMIMLCVRAKMSMATTSSTTVARASSTPGARALGSPRTSSRWTRSLVVYASDANGAPTMAESESFVLANDGHRNEGIPATPGVYAIYNEKGALQYVGLSRKVNSSVKVHAFELPQYCYSVRCLSLPDASKAGLQTAWKTWMMEYVAEAGSLPPGNTPDNKLFSERRTRPSKACVRLTDGKTPDMPAEELSKAIQNCVETHKIVAFIKGTREEPDCGFSHRMVNVLNELCVDYDTVNVLDDYYNPNLIFVIKDFSEWPTIPQLYFEGELLGGHDIVNSMHETGELGKTLGAQ